MAQRYLSRLTRWDEFQLRDKLKQQSLIEANGVQRQPVRSLFIQSKSAMPATNDIGCIAAAADYQRPIITKL